MDVDGEGPDERDELDDLPGASVEDLQENLERVKRRLHTRIRQILAIEHQLSALSAFWFDLGENLQPKDVLDTALDMIIASLRVDMAVVCSIQGVSRRVVVEASRGLERKAAEALFNTRSLATVIVPRTEIRGSLPPREWTPVMPAGPSFTLNGLDVLPELRSRGMKSALMVPFRYGGRVSGLVCVASRMEDVPGGWSSALFVTMCSLIALVMENQRISDQYKRVLKDLRASDRKFQQLLEETNDAIWTTDFDGKILSVNETFADLVGLHPRYIVGSSEDEFIQEEDLELEANVRGQAARRDVVDSHDLRLKSERGKYSTLKVTTSEVEYAGARAVRHIGKDVTRERKMMQDLRAYLKAITKAQEDERLRISRDLHDSTAQTLIAVLHRLNTFLTGTKNLSLSSSRFMWNIVEDIKGVLQEVRHYAGSLRPSILDDLGLVPAVEWLMEEHKRNSGIDVRLTTAGAVGRLPAEIETAVFRMVQEALNNVARHAEATRVTVELKPSPAFLNITITDNGKGFDIASSEELVRRGKLGIAGITERAELVGGKAAVSSAPGKGTTWKISVPLTLVGG
jgi:two-component system, NarL family, sensor histidine kinase DegS